MGRLGLHHRIVIPFVLVAIIATSAAAYLAQVVFSRTLEARVQAQLVSTAAVVSRSEFALNAAILRSVQEITGADVITYTDSGQVLASTFDSATEASLVASIVGGGKPPEGAVGNAGTAVVRMNCGQPCFVAYRRVPGRPDTIVALVASTAEIEAATRAVARTLVFAAGLSVIVMVLVSQIVARRVTAPLNRLVRFARELPTDDFSRRAPQGSDEVGRLGEAFNGMLKRLEDSQSALVRSEKLALAGLLAARVAHDIRNPLSSIKMQSQLLRATLAHDPEQVTALDAVLHDIDQVESVIRDLLDLARPGELKLEITQVNEVVHDVLRQMGAQLAYRKIAVDLELTEGLPPTLLDRIRFKQVLANLLTNASEAMPTGGHVSVCTRSVDEGSTLYIEVCDDGIGVDPVLIERVFDPFVSSKPDGVGLGLVNARAGVESHGGRIALERREPGGTRVRIWLPVRNHPAGTAHG